MTYIEKLRDPRWQRLRLEVFQAANFTCEKCGATDKTLHAHHRAYLKCREPWEYLPSQLACLCCDCHLPGADNDLLLEVVACAGRSEADLTRDGVAEFVHGLLFPKDPEMGPSLDGESICRDIGIAARNMLSCLSDMEAKKLAAMNPQLLQDWLAAQELP